MNEPGALLARFEENVRDQYALAWVRGVAAVLAGLGALAILLSRVPFPIFLVAVLALALSLAWLRQAVRARRAARREPARLLVHAHGFQLEEPGRTEWYGWEDVERVEVDEERLDVCVHRRGAPLLRLEPRYAGVEIHELVRTLSEAHETSWRAQAHGRKS